MTIKVSKGKRGASGDGIRAIVKVEGFSGTSAFFSVRYIQDALDVLKNMDIEKVEIGVDRESSSLLFFMDEDETIAYAVAPRAIVVEEEEEE